jgi:hypothetical protein
LFVIPEGNLLSFVIPEGNLLLLVIPQRSEGICFCRVPGAPFIAVLSQ